jgi:hypothetical protein
MTKDVCRWSFVVGLYSRLPLTADSVVEDNLPACQGWARNQVSLFPPYYFVTAWALNKKPAGRRVHGNAVSELVPAPYPS